MYSRGVKNILKKEYTKPNQMQATIQNKLYIYRERERERDLKI